MAYSTSSDRQQDELQSIQQQILEKKKNAAETVRRMKGLTDESLVIGTEANAELLRQREKLDNIDRRCDEIDAHLVSAQIHLNKLSSFFGGLKNRLKPPKSSFHKSASESQLAKADANKNSAMPAVLTQSKNSRNETGSYLGKARSDMDDLDRETDDGLRAVHDDLLCMKELALNMNRELESQIPLIQGIHGKVTVLDENIRKKKQQTNEILAR